MPKERKVLVAGIVFEASKWGGWGGFGVGFASMALIAAEVAGRFAEMGFELPIEIRQRRKAHVLRDLGDRPVCGPEKRNCDVYPEVYTSRIVDA